MEVIMVEIELYVVLKNEVTKNVLVMVRMRKRGEMFHPWKSLSMGGCPTLFNQYQNLAMSSQTLRIKLVNFLMNGVKSRRS